MITVIGHDGSPLPEPARQALAEAALVVGGARHLAALPVPETARTVVMGDVTAALEEIGEQAEKTGGVVVVASGDPGFFGIVRALRERGHRVRVLPAISSVAAAFARAGLPWDDALVVSAHGRELRRAVNACRAHPKVAVLTGPGAGPAELGRALFPQHPRVFVVCEDLGGPHERVVRCRPAEATTRPWRDPNVVLVLDETRPAAPRGWIAGARPGPDRWALPEEAFEHRGSVVTKAEVRAFALARLGPRIGDLIWDVGAGSGSVAIECARFGAAAIAVERDADSCERIRRNVRAHGVRVAVSRGRAPAVLEHLPDPDAVFVGGGGPQVVRACAARALRTVVVALASLERVRPTLDALTAEGLTAQAVQLQAARLAPLPGDVHRLAATNPVFVVWGDRNPAPLPSPPASPSRRPQTLAPLPETDQ
ncbi:MULTISPECIES: bifunctional cobalt-precorrin-7 (C(5))-methyltransferase/cobalt-precorrin-6B (C(15))-methyltransferase [Thermomonospora]|uniref:Precorrin-6y C5,15-methyltransferase (Decarboxylating), CbiE subunit n=1 Tax=Thermomonospora curvata (strain ATCC 19995 / DSM 43183 / JCM 3096 / KCTC 9072 / NBRC 15933 / NCIMB 10081 / Henssen B9) TaxID=471852 RepID=D1A9W3_THECD|nr:MULTISPECIES: bifunctional cobalt-precorrin-7 (C(5))-methyltransferase/cobalt-precorrin-6B (C(15))-methyltransferase [Thermomonospora]ACY96899.1 precorrin-6y C5,15-methyltransferase (decarboxylating), CbiE subunit [Thermomonospora curvata DSM 43183]PKK15183.1 MAG: bifunctional cobalt-precorrin-7 (C(5))-methyltransferase/cobalt-precorrin-6B (C(15))-methyltransferase [Thermomonospora sp. CIF 1]